MSRPPETLDTSPVFVKYTGCQASQKKTRPKFMRQADSIHSIDDDRFRIGPEVGRFLGVHGFKYVLK